MSDRAQVSVTEHHSGGKVRQFSGPEPEVCADLLAAYPFLAIKFGQQAPLEVLVSALDRAQAYSATSYGGDLVLKSSVGDPELHPAHAAQISALLGLVPPRVMALVRAGAFMAQKDVPPDDVILRALSAARGDAERAVFTMFNLGGSDGLVNLRAMADLNKSEPAIGDAAKVGEVKAAAPEGQAFADLVTRAAKEDGVFHVKLGGKHSGGSMLAFDPDSDTKILLKPGVGSQGVPAAAETSGSQAKREAAFYALARLWGLGDHVPECHLLLVDGVEYAALRLVDRDFENMADVQAEDPTMPRRICEMYRPLGQLHRWAALDLAAGNVDRHAGNVMVRRSDGAVYLIDHGSAFAGVDFHPEADPDRTFTPAYLRACAPAYDSAKTDEERLRALPRLSVDQIQSLEAWLRDLPDPTKALEGLGVEIKPVLGRLARLRQPGTAADLRVNGLWVL